MPPQKIPALEVKPTEEVIKIDGKTYRIMKLVRARRSDVNYIVKPKSKYR